MTTAHIVIAGGGVAAVEAVAALRSLAGPLPAITVLAPEAELAPRAASVAAPFGFGLPAALSFDTIRHHVAFESRTGVLARVEPDDHVVLDEHGVSLAYDKLLIAIGARPEAALDGAITFTGPADVPAVSRAIEQSERIAFVLPAASSWALPVYELAVMAAVELRSRGADPQITVVTPEPAPLWVFGEEASAAVAQLLAERGIALRLGAHAMAVRPGELEVSAQAPVLADAVVALPRLVGPLVPGLPHAAHGFIPVDAYGRVRGAEDVYAAGDATTFPLKQGGLAAQQADAAAETIAADLGLAVEPRPFRPIMRGLLLTGGAPLYLRSALTPAGQPVGGSAHRTSRRPTSSVSRRALWWPPSKIAGRYLAPLLATARPPVLAAGQLQDLAGGELADDRDDARELAFLLAEEEAAAGDFAQALRALDAAAAFTGGVLEAEWADRREQWARAGAAA